MEKFRPGPNEKILRKGNIDYLRGEQTFKAIMFHGAVLKCQGVLTSERFVACKESALKKFGLLLMLIAYLVPKKIIFEVPLERLASITYGEGKATSEFTLKDSDGPEYRIRLDGLFDKRATWIDLFVAALKNLRPDVEIQSGETGLEFVQRQEG